MKPRQLLAGIVISSLLSFAPVHAGEKVVTTNSVGKVYHLAEEDVMKQLGRLAAEGGNEDGWYYIPERELLIDHGTDITPIKYTPDRSVLSKIEGVKEATLYTIHIHPVDADLEKKVRGYLPPSFDDFVYFLEEIQCARNRGIDVSEARIVEWGGYWSVNLRNSNLEQLENKCSRAHFCKEYEKLVADYQENFEKMYNSNRINGSFKPFEKWLIANFEEDVARLGMDVSYHYF